MIKILEKIELGFNFTGLVWIIFTFGKYIFEVDTVITKEGAIIFIVVSLVSSLWLTSFIDSVINIYKHKFK